VWVLAGLVACSSWPQQQPMVTTSSAGEVGYPDEMGGGMWLDGSGGVWMDTTGAMRMGGRTGTPLGLDRAMVDAMTNENMVAHLATGDSLEIAVSRMGTQRATRSAVRDFAQRMVNEHSSHMQMGQQMAMQGGITPRPAPRDTMDVAMGRRMTARLSSAQNGDTFDRQFMRGQMMLHRHMLNELMMMQPRATGAARTLVDQTIPVVTMHLTDARRLWRELGGGNE
jgi:predicted outer membrane protein